ncbi:NAD(+) synthase [Peptoniphilus lacrimalis]|uniref:NAD(+) synthase n=1 Tax=Peptoniphilus lacrimalis TaxID=33031 RepID=UPI002550D4B5|nr:NAD(+) synthase [Peptoniphilus lacrimalis]MDK7722449.1 NAD(+) synthase [Peptoniphilus lacrimalis]MDK7732162.1 NAD(+) synthase [Peptoniphilus lacrimalis]MDK8281832.1 NAD(+) synthase [Peptoniphilus lacrimalis]
MSNMNYEKLRDDLVIWLRERAQEAHAKGFIFGLSGGIDSAVVAGLAKRVFPENSLGLIMPCDSIDDDKNDALKIAKSLDLEVKVVDLTNTYNELLKASFTSENKLARSNIKPRLRMTTLYYYGQDLGYLVVGPSNGSEWYVGYSTKYGDSGADIYPIANILKTDIFKLAKALDLPDFIIEKKPSAGLWKGQSDESEMGFTYEVLDSYIRGEKIPEEEIKKKIDGMHNRSNHKRMPVPMFKLK